ncbi:MAG: hypothetical protein AMJ90_01160 [candidate division Zixibacteria bacterium SM23_73_2]|nr:MAG: hypothetical protein AMJ90_01160 [candidate division Zixibacteria bacterium SM23_73_2]
MIDLILVIILSYLLGSFPTSVIFSRLWKGIDIRDYGSKNTGATNVYRVLGIVPAVIVLSIDAFKGIAAVLWISQIASNNLYLNLITLQLLAGVSAILGHIFPVYIGFKGGKGIGTGMGVFLALIPKEIILALCLFIIIVALTRYVSLGSLCATLFLSLALILEKYYFNLKVKDELVFITLALTILIFFTHKSNIKRLLKGEENKIGQKI